MDWYICGQNHINKLCLLAYNVQLLSYTCFFCKVRFRKLIQFSCYVLQCILIIGDVETHPGSGTYNSNPPVNITNNNVDRYISICNINIRSFRNKLHFRQNFTDEYILCVTESHLDVNINNDDLLLDFCSKTLIRKDRNN